MKEKLSKKTNVGALSVRNTRKNLPNCAQKGNKGITLVALIITIVVLLILAVVAIKAVKGDGILGYAKKARDDYQKAQDKEKDILSSYLKSLEISDVNGDEKLVDLYKKGKIKIGDYVNYQPSAADSYKPDGANEYDIGINTGYKIGELQEIEQEQLKWQVFGYDSVRNKILLISSTPTTETITFGGKDNYINVLDYACNSLYSNLNIGAVSINIRTSYFIEGNVDDGEQLFFVFLNQKGLTFSDVFQMTDEDEITKLRLELSEWLESDIANETKEQLIKDFNEQEEQRKKLAIGNTTFSFYCSSTVNVYVGHGSYKSEPVGVVSGEVTTISFKSSMNFRPIVELDSNTTFEQVPILTGEPTPEELKMLDVEDVKVVANSDGSGDNIAANTIASGTTLYITFTPTIENAKITKDGEEIKLPYPVTENAKHIFKITGTINKKEYTKEVEVIVNQFECGIKLLQKVNYNELTNGTKSIAIATSESGASSTQTLETENLDWRYMGTKEDGTILLVSKNLITDSSVTLSGKAGYVNGTLLLDKICDKLYGEGTYAEKARSMTIEDINELGTFDPETADPNKEGNAHLAEYGQMYKYRMRKDSSSLETSTSTDGGKTWSEYKTNTGFTEFIDPKYQIRLDKNNVGEEIYTNTAYHYMISEYLQLNSIIDNLSLLEKIELLGLENKLSNSSFWLASDFHYGSIDGYVSFGIRHIKGGFAQLTWIGNTNNGYVTDEFTYQYSPVIELKRDVKLVKGSNNTWEIVQM